MADQSVRTIRLGPTGPSRCRNRTGGRNRRAALYSPSRDDDAIRGRSPRGVLAGRARLVRGELPSPDPGPGRGLGGDQRRAATRSSTPRPGAARPWPRSCGAWTGWPATRARRRPAGTPGQRPRPVRLAAQGPDLRRRAQPARAADRHRPRRPASRRRAAADHRRQPHRRHAGRRPARARPAPAGHPHHDPREPVPAADQPGPRDPARRRARHRRRGPRHRRHASAARTWP